MCLKRTSSVGNNISRDIDQWMDWYKWPGEMELLFIGGTDQTSYMKATALNETGHGFASTLQRAVLQAAMQVN